MKVLLINGSSNKAGSTATSLKKICDVLAEEGIDSEVFELGAMPIRDCIGCGKCSKKDAECCFDDDCVNALISKAKECDAFVFGTPVYYAHPSGRILSALDRAFYAGASAFTHKPAAAVACARRAGTTASIDVLNKYFTYAQMPIVSSSYWNCVHGRIGQEVLGDEEGMQTIEHLARNMAWILKCISTGRENGITPPKNQKLKRTNFIR